MLRGEFVGARVGDELKRNALIAILISFAVTLVYLAIRRRLPAIGNDRETWKAVGGGVISMLGYGVVVWALSFTAMAKVSGLRETSILFAAIIGALFLKEPFTIRRAGCAIAITAGAILLAS